MKSLALILGILIGGVHHLDIEERVSQVIHNTQEVITTEELRKIFEVKTNPRAYWGFECSGQ
jgi:tyrosyl-tRNA synthetase